MEKAKCILCGHDAQRASYSSSYSDDKERVDVAGGYKYDCPECGLFSLDNYEHSKVEHFTSNEQKRNLSEYVKGHKRRDEYLPLSWDDIKRILGLHSKKSN